MTLKYGLGVIQGHRKMAPFESSDMVSYLHLKSNYLYHFGQKARYWSKS